MGAEHQLIDGKDNSDPPYQGELRVIGRVHTHDLGFEGPAAPRNDASPDLDPAESIRLAHMCPWLTRPPSAANPIAALAIRQMC